MLPMRVASVLVFSALVASPLLAQAPVAGRLVVEVGGVLGEGTVASVGLPTVTIEGAPAFTGTLVGPEDTTAFVYVDAGLRWLNRDAGAALVGREVWMGANDDGAFVYSPVVDGADALWTDRGLLVRGGDAAPGAPGHTLSWASRPGLLAGGAAYWMSGLTPDGSGPESRAFYVSSDRTAGSAIVLLAEGQSVGGVPVSALSFQFGLSSDGAHRAFVVTRATGSPATDGAVVLDGAVLAQEGAPLGPGTAERWRDFDAVRVDAQGGWLLAGATDAAQGADRVVVSEGGVLLREGGTVGGVALGSNVLGLALNDDGLAVWAWSRQDGGGALFVGRVDSLVSRSAVIVQTGQGLDTSGDGVADYTVTGLAFSSDDGHGALSLGPEPVVYARLALEPPGGGPSRHAIVGFDLTPFGVATDTPSDERAWATLRIAPNPSAAGATVTLRLARPEAGLVVDVLDVAGRRVATLHNGDLAAGPHSFALSALRLASGTYVVRAASGRREVHQTAIVVR